MMTRCKRCGAVTTIPASEDPKGEGRRIRSTVFDSSVKDEAFDYLHWDYRAVMHLSFDDKCDLGTIWGACDDCWSTVVGTNSEL